MEKLPTTNRLPVCGRTCLAAAACIGIFVLAPRAVRAAEASTPLEVFGRLPTLEDVIISPDGTKIAFVRTIGDQRKLIVGMLAQGDALGSVRVGETKLRRVEWVDDDNILATVSSTSPPPFGYSGATREWYQLTLYNISKRHVGPLSFDIEHERTFNVVVGETAVRDVGGQPVLYVPGYYVTDKTLPGLFTFSIPERRARLIAKGSDSSTGWLIDEAGRIAAQFVYHDNTKIWEIRARKDDRMALVASGTAPIDVPNILGFSADGTAIIVRFIENGDSVWKPLYVKDGTWGPPLEKGAAFARVIENRKSGRIIGGVRELGDNQYVLFDNELQAHWNAILRAFPNERVHLVSHSDDFSRVIVKVFGDNDGYAYELYDWYAHQAIRLGAVYEGLTAPAPIKAISYAAADGLIIPGFLTLPRGGAEKGLPLIVLPHGGPAVVDTLEFDWWAQALASQGYAVLRPTTEDRP
jgi:dipeptidyl aminopeptidase/acylaminoacyl peptidase